VPCRIPLALSGRRFLSTTKPKSGTALGGYGAKMELVDLSEETTRRLFSPGSCHVAISRAHLFRCSHHRYWFGLDAYPI
jgi:hypothetical protein